MSDELWRRYCSFYEKSFSEQVAYNEQKSKEYFEEFKRSKLAEHLCNGGVDRFEDIPLTTYDDYPILYQFGEEVEKREKTLPRRKGEPLWDYYRRISCPLAPMLEGWLMDEYALCQKTSGSSGKSKWFAFGKTYLENIDPIAMPLALFACSDKWGESKIKEGDTVLNMFAALPHASGMAAKAFEKHFKIVPPIPVLDEVTDMRKKIDLVLKYVENGAPVDIMVGVPSTLKMTCEYFTNPEKLWRDRYQSFPFGIAKLVLYLKYLRSKRSRKYDKARDILPIKGLMVSGWDGTVYLDYFREQFGVEPLNLYGTTDILLPLMGRPHRKFDLFPNLSATHFEFLDRNEKVHKINELTKNEVYEVVATTFGGCTVRYRPGDLFRVIDFEADGTPVFRFESRTVGLIDVYNYYRISEAIARDVLAEAGFHSENWAVCHELAPREHVKFLLEKEVDSTEEQMAEKLFGALRRTLRDFDDYVGHFKIRTPAEAVEVEYLKKGAFMRYMLRRQREGLPFGQMKPPKVIGENLHSLAELLRSI